MAMESPPLLDTLIAWASSHLSLCHEPFQVDALEDRSSALSSFGTSLSTEKLLPETSLAGCLVLCSMEAILGDTAQWYMHLVGASHIVQPDDHGRTGIDALCRNLEGRWLLRNFAYHDILMSVALNCAPLIPGHYWLLDSEGVVDSYFGVASRPMALLSSISSLNAEMMAHKNSQTSILEDPNAPQQVESGVNQSQPDFSTRAFHIERELQTWTCASSSDSSLMHLAEGYRSAALIHLYRVLRRYIPSQTYLLNQKIQNQVQLIIQNVSEMPLNCLPECTLLFPLFLAGGEAQEDRHREYIRYRMESLGNFRRFKNVDVALEVLEELWANRNECIPGVTEQEPLLDWLDILEEKGWRLALS
jgi:transcriptional activator protein UGA3